MAKQTSFFINIGQGLSMLIGLPSIPTWGSKDRPKKAAAGTFGFNSHTKTIEFWDGKSWYGAAMDES